jgi:hypothetical protein
MPRRHYMRVRIYESEHEAHATIYNLRPGVTQHVSIREKNRLCFFIANRLENKVSWAAGLV